MGFASMNGVIAARGMQGTSRQGTASFSAPHLQGQAPPAPQAPPTGSSYTHGAGMQMTGRYAPQEPMGPVQQPKMNVGTSISNDRSAVAREVMDTPNAQGVVAGQTMPSAVGPQQNPQFDPNDPNNAALAGYQMAR